MKKRLASGMIVAGFCVAAFGCGGGGDGSATPTTAVVTIGTAGTPSADYKGVELTVNLPAGVTVKTDPANPKQTAAGVLKLSGAFARYTSQVFPRPVYGTYSSAGTGGPGVVKIGFASGTAIFPVGELATLTCDFASGASVNSSNFSVTEYAFFGTGGARVTELTPVSPPVVTLK